jgi:hypothetical protein
VLQLSSYPPGNTVPDVANAKKANLEHRKTVRQEKKERQKQQKAQQADDATQADQVC